MPGHIGRRGVLASGVSLLASRARAEGFPDPTDEAALYAAAKKEGGVVWYGGAPLEPMQGMARSFEGKYPGVKVAIDRYVGVAQYQRFMQETQSKQYIADVLHVGDEPSMADLIDRHYVADWKVPSYDRVPPSARIKVNAYTAYIIDDMIAYNPVRVTPEEVKILASGWKGILDPRFKGRIALSDQRFGGFVCLVQMFLESKYKDQFGVPYLKALAGQKPAVYNDVVIPVDRVIAGDQDIAYIATEGVVMVKYQQGAPIRWVHPKPTPAFGNTWFGVSAFAPHPNAARLFVNWVMSDDGARAVQDDYGGIPVLDGFADRRPVTKEAWYDPITADRYVPDWDQWARTSDRDMDLWDGILKAVR